MTRRPPGAHFDGSIDSTFTEDIYERTGRTVDDNTNGTTHSETVCVSTVHESRAETEDSTGFTTYFLGDKTDTEDDRSEEHVRWQSGSQGQTRDMTCHSWGTVVRQEEVAVDGGTVSLDEDHHSDYNYEVRDWASGCASTSSSSTDHTTCHTWLHDAADVAAGVVWAPLVMPDTALTGHESGAVESTSHVSVTNGVRTSNGSDSSDTHVWAGGTVTHHNDCVYWWDYPSGSDSYETHASDASSLDGLNYVGLTLIGQGGGYPLTDVATWVGGSFDEAPIPAPGEPGAKTLGEKLADVGRAAADFGVGVVDGIGSALNPYESMVAAGKIGPIFGNTGWYTAGTIVGAVGTGIVIGAAAGGAFGLCGSALQMVAKAYSVGSAAMGIVGAVMHISQGKFGVSDALAFLPVVTWGVTKAMNWGSCFVGDTEVVTGSVAVNGVFSEEPIDDIVKDDMVLARDANDPNAPLELRRVTAVEKHEVYELTEVTLREADGDVETISTTAEHPFYVDGRGWTGAGHLESGWELSSADGQEVTVVSVATVAHPEGVAVYNLTVEGDHTFFVASGEDGALAAVWVHNSCGVPGDSFKPNAKVTKPYVRPSGAGPTAAQRAAVQGKPCVECGKVTRKQVADHIEPLCVEYYRTGTNNITLQSRADAVQAHCPECSCAQGGWLSAFCRRMKGLLGL